MADDLIRIEITKQELKIAITALKYYHLQQQRNKFIYGPGAGSAPANNINSIDQQILQLTKYLETF